MTNDPPIDRRVPLRPRRPGRHEPGRARRQLVAAAVLVLACAAGCGPPVPGTPAPDRSTPAGSVVDLGPSIDGLLIATNGRLLVSDAGGRLLEFDPAPGRVASVTAAAGVVVAIDEAGEAAFMETKAAARSWTAMALPADQHATVRLAALGPTGAELAIAAGDPQGPAFTLAILDIRTGASRAIPVNRGLNGPPSWLGPRTVALDVIRDAGHSGIATIELGSGVVTDRPGSATVASSSIDGTRLALDDPATGDVIVADVASWEAGALAAPKRIHGPPATGVDALAMAGDGSRLAIVRRSDAGGSVDVVVRRGDAWRIVRSMTGLGDGPVSVAWLE
jgi:hypothetical protein